MPNGTLVSKYLELFKTKLMHCAELVTLWISLRGCHAHSQPFPAVGNYWLLTVQIWVLSVDGPVSGAALSRNAWNLWPKLPRSDLWSMRLTDVVRSRSPHLCRRASGVQCKQQSSLLDPAEARLSPHPLFAQLLPRPSTLSLTPFRFLLRIFPL